MKLLYFGVAILVIIFSSCYKDHFTLKIPTKGDFLVFGYGFARCSKDCREMYLLTREYLYEDSNNPSIEEVTFNPESLSRELFEKAEILWDMPESLKSNTVNPDALIRRISDFNYYVRGMVDGTSFQIVYDGIDSTVNRELYEYNETIQTVLGELR